MTDVTRWLILDSTGQVKTEFNDNYHLDIGAIFETRELAEKSELYRPEEGDTIAKSIGQTIEGSSRKVDQID